MVASRETLQDIAAERQLQPATLERVIRLIDILDAFGADTLIGGPGPDKIYGVRSNNMIRGGAGDFARARLDREEAAVNGDESVERLARAAGNLGVFDMRKKVHSVSCWGFRDRPARRMPAGGAGCANPCGSRAPTRG